MAKTRSITRNQNDDASIRMRFKSFDKDGVASWSDVNHDVLFIVMMQLGFVDFFAFSRVCKSWRSLAFSNRKMFMRSKPPMKIWNWYKPSEDDWCTFKDIEGHEFKTIIPHFTGTKCVGSTCGYLILFGKKTRDFWLVNPITGHQLHFPGYPIYVADGKEVFRDILVFSPSVSEWLFVVLHNIPFRNQVISFCIAGKRRWNHVSSYDPIRDIYVFKGTIYTLCKDCSLAELRLSLNQKRKSTLLKCINSPDPDLFQTHDRSFLVSSGENLYLWTCSVTTNVLELNFGEKKWVSPEKTKGEYAFFISLSSYSAAIKLKSLVGPRTQHKSHDYFPDNDKSRKCIFYYESMWYYPRDCLSVNLLDE